MMDMRSLVQGVASRRRLLGRLGACMLWAMGSGSALGQARLVERVPEGLSESAMIATLKSLRENGALERGIRLVRISRYADALVKRYPESLFRIDAQLYKLSALSGLAARDPYYLGQLLEASEAISCEAPTGRLASENAFFAIQAFVYGARYEAMPQEKLSAGVKERYEAFLDDFPESKRVPVIMASLVRNLIRGGKLDEAGRWVGRMQRSFPSSKTTLRAAGELHRTRALDHPLALEHKGDTGVAIKTVDHKGHVVVVHLWTAWTDAGVSSLNPMAKLYKTHGPSKVALLSLNLDRNAKRAKVLIEEKHLPWSQSFDGKGLESELAMGLGILRIPTFLVIDQAGVLRYVGGADALVDQVTQLLSKNDGKSGTGK